MATPTPSAFGDLGESQLHYLKSQYVAAVQVIDQTEAGLKAQLAEVGKARKQLEELMQQLDQQLSGSPTPTQPPTPTRPPKTPVTRPRTPRRPDTP